MGRRVADEHLPEVVPQQDQQPPMSANPTSLPEVVPDSSPEFAQQRYYIEADKIPAYYDTTPKFPYEQYMPGSPEQQQYYQQQWGGAGSEPGISAISPNSSVPWQSMNPGGDDQQTYVGSEPEPEKRICGFRKRPFIIIAAIVALVIVAAAIGGGVGGAMAARQSDDDDDDPHPAETTPGEASSTPSATPTSAISSSTSTSSAPTPSITFLNNQTDPAVFRTFAFQGFAGNNFTGQHSPILYEEGFYDLGFNATSYIWLPNQTDCCITFCASRTKEVGYRCDVRRRLKTDDDDGFPRLSIWCGRWSNETNERMQKTCS